MSIAELERVYGIQIQSLSQIKGERMQIFLQSGIENIQGRSIIKQISPLQQLRGVETQEFIFKQFVNL